MLYTDNTVRSGHNDVTYSEFVAELDRASLSIRAFAALLGMRPNSISNYASVGEVPAHLGLIAALLAELKTHRIGFDAAIARAAHHHKPCRYKLHALV